MMIKCFFWNLMAGTQQSPDPTRKARLLDLLERLVQSEQDIDILMFAEWDAFPIQELSDALNMTNKGTFKLAPFPKGQNKVIIFSRYQSSFVKTIEVTEPIASALRCPDPRITVHSIELPLFKTFTLIGVHLVDMINYNEIGRRSEVLRIVSHIRHIEKDICRHHRTLVIGDFNLNSFQDELLSIDTFHAIPARDVVIAKGKRELLEAECHMYYNPMWNFFGDAHTGSKTSQFYSPGGTYYFSKSKHFMPYWNMLDQVLLRKDLLRNWQPENVKILAKIGEYSLLTNEDKPNTKDISDHLPLQVQFDPGRKSIAR